MNTLETKDFSIAFTVDITIPDPDTPLINALVAELGPDNVRALLDGTAPAREDDVPPPDEEPDEDDEPDEVPAPAGQAIARHAGDDADPADTDDREAESEEDPSAADAT